MSYLKGSISQMVDSERRLCQQRIILMPQQVKRSQAKWTFITAATLRPFGVDLITAARLVVAVCGECGGYLEVFHCDRGSK